MSRYVSEFNFPLTMFLLMVVTLFVTAQPISHMSAQDSPEAEQKKTAQEKSDDKEKSESDDSADKQEEESDESGEEILAKATELKIKAKNLSDLDRVIELCESSLKKKLSEVSKETASELLEGTLLDYAEKVSRKIFQPGQPDPRWQFLRQQALKKLNRLEELKNEWSETYLLMAKLHMLPRGNREKAQDAASKAVKFAGEDVSQLSEALFIRGSLTEDEQARLADFNQAVKIDPTNEKALRERAAHYLRNEKHDKAIEDFEQLIELTDGDPKAYQQLIESMLFAGRTEDALEVSEEALGQDEEQAGLHSLRARIFLIQAGELQESQADKELSEDEQTALDEDLDELNTLALKSLNRALELSPRDLLSLMMRAEIHLRNDDLKEARKDVDRLLVIAPGLARGVFLRSIVSSAEGDFAAAIRDLEILVRSDPDNMDYRLQLANMFSADDRPQKAIEIFEEILDDDNRNLRALRGLADAWLGMGNHSKALKYYEKALELDEDDDHVLNNLAWMLATSPDDDIRDGKRSIELGLKACEVTDYKEAHILSTLAAGYAETGDFEKAREWSAKSVELADDSNLEDLKKELESYKKNKPWRERQEPKDDDKKSDSGGDFEF